MEMEKTIQDVKDMLARSESRDVIAHCDYLIENNKEADKKEDGEGSAANDEDKKDEADKIDVAVTKVWSDEEDKDRIRPAKVTIKLFADGTDTTLTLMCLYGI